MQKIGEQISHKLWKWFSSNLVCEVVCMEGIKYGTNQSSNYRDARVENSDLVHVVPTNNTLVCNMSSWLLAHDCVSWSVLTSVFESSQFVKLPGIKRAIDF